MMCNVERFKLVTRVSELEAELAAARRSLRDDVMIAALNGIISGRCDPMWSPTQIARNAAGLADAFMIERDKR